MSWSLGENVKAREYIEKSLAFRKENINGDKEGEASQYSNLGNVFQNKDTDIIFSHLDLMIKICL